MASARGGKLDNPIPKLIKPGLAAFIMLGSRSKIWDIRAFVDFMLLFNEFYP